MKYIYKMKKFNQVQSLDDKQNQVKKGQTKIIMTIIKERYKKPIIIKSSVDYS